ncbi:SMI1/KNR4 family protein [Aureivirga sp. CE67]|uniref:SMI1/KNR4 family protein n=1 Tax=Aureivirga sp. CE67 TaxID=1788983 RepID=UPI0018C97722|nr:SMI1/KNR4 family protein [Aureivirga sp. CE67]
MPFRVEEKYIIETELALNVKFPESFKNKMRKENGGVLYFEEIEIQLFPFFDKSDKKRISRTCNHIGLETKNARSWNNFPENAIAIGGDGYGNIAFLMHNDNRVLTDAVFYWDHEIEEIEKLADSICEIE